MRHRAYYNEFEPYAAAWLRNLIAEGLIPAGDVDERSIVDVEPGDLAGYTQVHFFAGLGGWGHALRLAGWPDERPIWTGSPPCQDVSLAGAVWNVRSGMSGARTSLAFKWLDLVGAVRPRAVAFENVPGIGEWLAEITGRLESFGYRVSRYKRATADVGGPHLRRRVWLIADGDGEGLEEPWAPGPCSSDRDPRRAPPGNVWAPAPGRACLLADGFPARVAAIRAFGNAIDPHTAADVISAHFRR